ncbi:uncharacterized protein LOC111276376 [Durio zibethinus]|uniref:Uncharacterized protein LOC111276376 n=1 Tax=Durio zibethinus TaxID=66656 RepID=A0A6P5WPR2_DURZI|nr:uncharacterized protein LOC111276376 [Durio zibethinus]
MPLCDNPKDFWLQAFMSIKQNVPLETFMLCLWTLWFSRNMCFHQGKCSTVRNLCGMARRMGEGRMGQEMQQEAVMTNTQQELWQPLGREEIKLKVDAAFVESSKEASLGAMCRDTTRKILLSTISKEARINNPLMAEICAIRWGLQAALEHGIESIIVDSDSLMAIKEIVQAIDSFFAGFNLIQDISLVQNDFFAS